MCARVIYIIEKIGLFSQLASTIAGLIQLAKNALNASSKS